MLQRRVWPYFNTRPAVHLGLLILLPEVACPAGLNWWDVLEVQWVGARGGFMGAALTDMQV